MSTPYRDSTATWAQSTSPAGLYHHDQDQYYHRHQPKRPEASIQPSWPSIGEWKARTEEPCRSPPTPLKLPHPTEPADEADLSRQLDQVVDLLSQQPRSDGGPRRPMNAFLIFARWRRMQLAQVETARDREAPLWTNEGRKRRKPSIPDLGLKPSDVSTALGVEWRGLTPQQQAPFLRKAGELRNDFDRRHPDYKFRRGPKGAAKIRRQERRERVMEARRRLQLQKATIENAHSNLEEASQHDYGYGLTEKAVHNVQQGLATGHCSTAYQHIPPDHARHSFSLSDDPPETPMLDTSSLSPYAANLSTLPYYLTPSIHQKTSMPSRTSEGMHTSSSSFFARNTTSPPEEAATAPLGSGTTLDPRSRSHVFESPFWPVGSRTDLPPLHHSIEFLAPTLHSGQPCIPTHSNSPAVSNCHTAPLRNFNHGRVPAFYRSLPPPPPSFARQQTVPCPALHLHLSDGALPHRKYHYHQHHQQRQQQPDYLNTGSYQFPSYAATASNSSSGNGNGNGNGNGRPVAHLLGESGPWTPAREQGLQTLLAPPVSITKWTSMAAVAAAVDSHCTPSSPPPLQGPPRLSRPSSTLEAALHFSTSKSDSRPRAESQLPCSSRLPGGNGDGDSGGDERWQYTQAGAETGTVTGTETATASGHSSTFSRLLEVKFGHG